MEHIMRLDVEPFNLIKNGKKKVEYRLNDEKRQKIKVGDTITFIKRPLEDESIKVKVTDLKHYNTLLDMYSDTFDMYLYKKYKTPEDAVKDTTYYSAEDISKYGCLGIFIELI